MSSDIARGVIAKLRAENKQLIADNYILRQKIKEKQVYRIEINYEPKRHTKNRRRA